MGRGKREKVTKQTPAQLLPAAELEDAANTMGPGHGGTQENCVGEPVQFA